MKNQEIRDRISNAGLKHWQVAEVAGVSPYTLCVWLRTELSGKRLERVQAAIETLTRKESTCNG